ncbi:MAG: LCP family protein, partial [Candidatus Moraniibacteriota bacterium]
MNRLFKSSRNTSDPITGQKPVIEAHPKKETLLPDFSPQTLLHSDELSEQKRKHPQKKAFIIICVVILCIFLGVLFFFLYKSVSVGRNIQLENTPQSSFLSDMKQFASTLIKANQSPLLGEKEGRINILLLGRAGEHYPGQNLTDTVVIMSIDTKNKKVSLLSLPRDLYVEIPDT